MQLAELSEPVPQKMPKNCMAELSEPVPKKMPKTGRPEYMIRARDLDLEHHCGGLEKKKKNKYNNSRWQQT